MREHRRRLELQQRARSRRRRHQRGACEADGGVRRARPGGVVGGGRAGGDCRGRNSRERIPRRDDDGRRGGSGGEELVLHQGDDDTVQGYKKLPLASFLHACEGVARRQLYGRRSSRDLEAKHDAFSQENSYKRKSNAHGGEDVRL